MNIFPLPGELRNRIYDFLSTIDLETFVERTCKPGLLQASTQFRREYSDVFFANPALEIDAYSGHENGWRQIKSKQAKRMIFEQCVFIDLLDFWSFASARRYCQRMYSDWQGNVQTGIMTIRTRGGIKRWQCTWHREAGGRLRCFEDISKKCSLTFSIVHFRVDGSCGLMQFSLELAH